MILIVMTDADTYYMLTDVTVILADCVLRSVGRSV
jgi:hypothetical protein